MPSGRLAPGSRPPLRRGASFAARPPMPLAPPGGVVGSNDARGSGGGQDGQDGNGCPGASAAAGAAAATAGAMRRRRLRRGATFGSGSRVSADLPMPSGTSSPTLQYGSHDRFATRDGGGGDGGGVGASCADDSCGCRVLEARVHALERHLDILRDVLIVATDGGSKEASNDGGGGGGGGSGGGWASWFGGGSGGADGGKSGSAASRRRRALRAEVASLRRTTNYLFARLSQEGREERAGGVGSGSLG